MSKRTTLHVQHTFLYISSPSLQNYNMKFSKRCGYTSPFYSKAANPCENSLGWVRSCIVLDHFHVCDCTSINCPRGRKDLKRFCDKCVVNKEGFHKSQTFSTIFTLLIKPPHSALNFEKTRLHLTN